MKKIFILIIFIIFLLCGTNNINASDIYQMKWYNTIIEIPVGESLYDYINLPYAKLYINNIESDHEVSYLRGDSQTGEDLININKIGSYKLSYTAISDIEDTILVTFNVVDKIKPTIKNISGIAASIGEVILFDNYFLITDNYDKSVTVSYNDSLINYNEPGTYKLLVTCIDSSNNINTQSFNVSIFDLTKPSILKINDLVINYNEKFNPLLYFKAYDEVCGDLSNRIKTSYLDTSILGYQEITISVTDDYSNTYKETFLFNVIDNENPKITLSCLKDTITIDDVNNQSFEFYREYITSITDNYSKLEISDCNIDYQNVKSSIGEYEVIFSIKDDFSNEGTASLILNVICDSTPVLEVTDIHIKVGETINYYNYIKASDKYDGDLSSDIVIDDSSVNINKKGIYFVTISVKNSSGKYSSKIVTIYVEKSFIESYYWIFILLIGVCGIVTYFIIKKRKIMI